MGFSRRHLIATGLAAAAPGASLAAPRPKAPKACAARAAYAGPPMRASLADWQLDIAARAGSSRLTPFASDPLDEALEKAAGYMPKAMALTAAVARPDGGVWTQTRTAARGGVLPERFFWASAGKAYTATAVLQLVEEGKLGLEATLDRWAPNLPNAALISVEDLLAHTSGIYSFQADEALRAEPGYKPPDRLLAAAAAHPAEFCPGASWGYSNTGYVLLGRIIEAADGKPYHEALKARIVDRLELRETTILAPRQQLAGLAAPAPAEPAGGTADDVTTPFAAGAVAASAADVVRFWRALMANRLHSKELTRRRFARLHPMIGVRPSFYGLGVMVNDLSAADPKLTDTWLSHAGGLPGAAAVVTYSMEKRAFAAVALTGEGLPEATAHLLLSKLPTLK